MIMAERTRDAIEQAHFMFNERTLRVTVSVGVATLSSEGSEGVETLVSRADEALYSAKRAGRNRVVAFPTNTTLGMLMMNRR